MSKVALLTVYTDNFRPLANIVLPNMQKYCDKHGYTLHAYNITGTDIYYGFKKIEKLIDLLNKNEVKIVLCLDLDTLITNHNIKVESFIDDDHHFYICKDVKGVNAGAFIVKNSWWSIGFLNLIFNNCIHFNCEQEVIELFKEANGYKNQIKILGHPSINSLVYDEYAPNWGVIGDRKIDKPTHEEGNWERGDFILHLPGIPLERRVEIFKNLENEIIL